MKKTQINVKGMHCNSCKLLLEKSLAPLQNVESVHANFSKGTVTIDHQKPLNTDEINQIIEDCGYQVTESKVSRPRLSQNIKDYKIMILSLLGFVFLYFILSKTGFLNFNLNGNSPSLGLVALIGLTAGFSTCMAIVGGLVLAISAKQNKDHEELSFGQKIVPHLWLNVGRIVGFGILGGFLGLFGSVISVSPFVMSVMTLVIGIVMLLLGINLTNISPRLSAISLTLPTGTWFKNSDIKTVKSESGKRWKLLITGALTFFLPCGFTFAMQMYAIGTGSFWMGMAVMSLFAIGTLPGLLSIGSLTSIFKGKKAQVAYQAIGVLVILFGLFNVSNAYGVLKTKIPSTPTTTIQDQTVTTINMTYGENQLSPNVIDLELGKRYKIVVEDLVDIYSCLNTLYIPGLDENYKELKKGQKVEFNIDATKPGEYKFVCATMGMYQGSTISIK
ncbi:MAG: sulfite exporter TauE/SafE family protein [Candidatus Absconditabacteria bacterium]